MGVRQALQHHPRAGRVQDARPARRHPFLRRGGLRHHRLGEKPGARAGRPRTKRRPTPTSSAGCAAASTRCSRRSAPRSTSATPTCSRNTARSVTSPSWCWKTSRPYQVGKIQSAGLEAKGFGFQTAPLRVYPRGTRTGPRARLSLARPAAQPGQISQRRRDLRPLQGRVRAGAGLQPGPDRQGRHAS